MNISYHNSENPSMIDENQPFQITTLKKNLDNHGDALQDNYRPPQAVNGRTVYHFSRDDAAGKQCFFSMHIWRCGRNFCLSLIQSH